MAGYHRSLLLTLSFGASAFCGLAQTTSPYVINTIAGRYPAIGNGAQATAVYLRSPQFVRTDPAGNLYFSEAYGYSVRKVTPSGIITTIAGTGMTGTPQYGQPAASSPIAWAEGLAFDSSGALNFASNAAILKIPPTNALTLVAGATAGSSGDSGPALQAGLSTSVLGITFDQAGNLYLADTGNNKVRKVDTNGVITTVAGNGLAGLSGDGGPGASAELNTPTDVAVDTSGNLYIADRGNRRIRMVAPNGTISTFAGNGASGFGGDGGSALSAQFSNLSGLAFDATGRLYLTDSNRVRRITTSSTGTVIETIAGGGPGFSGDGGAASVALFNAPTGLTVDNAGNLYIADTGNHRIRKITPAGAIGTIAGTSHFGGDGGPATFAVLGSPSSVAVGAAGVYIADTDNNRVRLLAPDGTISTVAGAGTLGFSGDGGAATAAQLANPQGVALDAIGTLYISDTGNNRIRMVGHSGLISTLAGGGPGLLGDGGPATAATLNGPVGLTVGPTGDLFIADRGNGRIRLVDFLGNISTVAGNGSVGFAGDGGKATSATLDNPLAVAEDTSGNIYIADHSAQRIRKVDTGGVISTIVGTGTAGIGGDGGQGASANLGQPSAIVVDSNSNLLIGDPQFGAIRKVTPAGIISTIAGSGSGYAGDGVFALTARMGAPPAPPLTLMGLATGPNGTIYVGDWANEVVRALTPNVSAALTIVSGNNQVGTVGSTLPNALTVSVVGPTGTPVPNVTITFLRTSGDATFSAITCLTAANGQCGVNVTLGTTVGPVTISATGPNLAPIVFTVTATPLLAPGPSITQAGVVNGASFQPGISPNAWITIQGTNLFGGQPDTWTNSIVNGSLPTTLDGVSVSIGGQLAYISYVSASQINAVAPNVAPGNVTVSVTNSLGTSGTVTVAAQAAQPAFFAWPGGSYVVATRQDFSDAAKNGVITGVTTIPAKPGDVIILWGTGFGPTSPAAPVGVVTPSSSTYLTANTVSVSVGGVSATVYGAALAPGFAALYQVAIQIPPSLTSGDYQVTAAVNGVQSPSGALITVQQQ